MSATTEPQRSNVLRFPEPAPRLRRGVPPFDPLNPAHLRAWESIWDFGNAYRSDLSATERGL